MFAAKIAMAGTRKMVVHPNAAATVTRRWTRYGQPCDETVLRVSDVLYAIFCSADYASRARTVCDV